MTVKRPHESGVMSMLKGLNGIFSNISYFNFTYKHKSKK